MLKSSPLNHSSAKYVSSAPVSGSSLPVRGAVPLPSSSAPAGAVKVAAQVTAARTRARVRARAVVRRAWAMRPIRSFICRLPEAMVVAVRKGSPPVRRTGTRANRDRP